MLIGIAMVVIGLYHSIADLRNLLWPLFGIPFVALPLAQMNAPFTEQARQERDYIVQYLMRLLEGREEIAESVLDKEIEPTDEHVRPTRPGVKIVR